MKRINQLMILAFTAFIVSCNSDDSGDLPEIEGDYANGVFVLNEGIFNASNASVSFISSSGEIQNHIFETVNGRMLGDVAQSMVLENGYAYIIVNNSNTVEIVNQNTFESIATISEGLQNPRYIEIHNNKAYVSNWGDATDANDDFIAVIDLSNNSVSSTISVVEGPERMVEENGKLYVAQQGGWGYGNSISVIDLNSNSVVSTIQVADVPAGMVEENGYLYVLCTGKESWTGEETVGALYKINLQNNQITDEFEFGEGIHPAYLDVENDKVYYTIGNNIYQTSAANIENQGAPFIATGGNGLQILYGFNVVDGWIYATDAKDFQSDGEVFVYSLNGDLSSQIPIGGYLPKGVFFED